MSFSVTLHLNFWERVFYWTWVEFTISARQCGQWARDSPVSVLLGARFISMHHSTWLFYVGLWELNSSPQAWTTSTLHTVPSPQPVCSVTPSLWILDWSPKSLRPNFQATPASIHKLSWSLLPYLWRIVDTFMSVQFWWFSLNGCGITPQCPAPFLPSRFP